MRRGSSWTTKPNGQCFTLERGNPLANGLVAYWPFTEGAGHRFTELVTGKGPYQASGGAYALSWAVGPPGLYYAGPENNNIDQTIYRIGAGAMTTMTFGGLFIALGVGGISGVGARQLVGVSGSGGVMTFSSMASIDYHWRVDFVGSSAFFRATTGQWALGSIRTLFATWRAGSAPSGYTALWPQGSVKEITYNDRGSTGTSCTMNDVAICNQDAGGSRWGPSGIWWMGIWNRVLRLDEMQELHDYPWQLIHVPRVERVSEAALAGGWASRVRHGGDPGAHVI